MYEYQCLIGNRIANKVGKPLKILNIRNIRLSRYITIYDIHINGAKTYIQTPLMKGLGRNCLGLLTGTGIITVDGILLITGAQCSLLFLTIMYCVFIYIDRLTPIRVYAM